VTIEAAEGEIVDGFPRPIAAALWSAVEVRDAAPEGRRRVTIDAAVTVPAGYELRLYSGPQNGGATALSNRIMQPGETFTTSGSLPLGSTCYNLLFWRRIDDGAWTQASENQVAFQIAGLEVVTPPAEEPTTPTEPGQPGATSQRTNVAADGVTFAFDATRTVGYFMADVFGQRYPYVVGTTRVSYTPAPGTSSGRVVNGAVKNPVCATAQGFDSLHGRRPLRVVEERRLGHHHAQPRRQPGRRRVRPRSSRTKMRNSVEAVRRADLRCRGAAGRRLPAAVRRHREADAPRGAGRLVAAGQPCPHRDHAVLVRHGGRTSRLVQDMAPSWNRDHLESPKPPAALRPRRLQAFRPRLSDGQLQLHARAEAQDGAGPDPDRHRPYGLFRSAPSGVPWEPDGGHNSGRKFRIMFAGHMLGVGAMRDVVLQTSHTTDPTLKTQVALPRRRGWRST
jgi:hypothetical protein